MEKIKYEIKSWIRKDLKDFKPYNASEIPYKIKLDANESPFNIPYNVKESIIKWIKEEENLNLYPDTDCLELKEKLSELWNVESSNIICGSGSDQLIEYICKVFLEPNDIVIIPSPSFSMYSITTILNRGKILNLKLNNNFTYDSDAIIKLCKENNPKLLFICTPNNPTGKSISNKDIEKILKEVKCPIIIDEAYAEFNNETAIPYIKKYSNIIVLRTFSKAYGLAGLRIGYAIADKEFIKVVETVKTPFNLNTLSQKIAIEILKNDILIKNRIKYLKHERNRVLKKLKLINSIKAYPSDANFIYIESRINIALKLKNKGILIREFKPNDKMYISRITVGSKQQNKKLLKVLRKLKE